MSEGDISQISVGEFETVSQLLASSESLQLAFIIMIVGIIAIAAAYRKFSSLIKSKKLTKSSFANEVGVQRSSLAHFFSGRNKPSLEFFLKIKNKYPEIDLNWIISGIKIKKNNACGCGRPILGTFVDCVQGSAR